MSVNQLLPKDLWYRLNKILSYKAILNMIVGMRGGGKTYSAKEWCIRDFLRNGYQFVWTRRYETELEESLKDFFGSVRNNEDLLKEFGDITYEVRGKTFLINGEVAGVGVPLSTSGKFKSGEYPRVDKIIFDEFLIEGASHYIKNEVDVLFGLIETIQRHRDNVRVIMISNSVKFSNPYFMYFKIKPFKGEFLHLKNRSVVVQMYYNEAFAEYKQETRFGKMIRGSSYENYAIKNEFKDLSNRFIEKRSIQAQYSFTLRYESIDYGFWIDNVNGLLYASDVVDPSCKDKFVLSELDHDVNYILVKNYRATHLYQLKTYYEMGRLRFENNLVKSGVTDILMFL